jgi:uncharacterized protein YecE (DUF72 family)
MSAAVKIGITSWADRSLLASGFYPRGTKTPEARLRYYASQFPIVENDAAYYAIPTEEHARTWVERTPDGFTMNVKAFAALTGHYTDPARLPGDLRGALSEAVRSKTRAYPKDLGPDVLAEIARRFREAIEPLRASRRLGVVLFQYPVWFPCTRDNDQVLLETRTLVPGCRVAIEFRNATWMSERNRERTLQLLDEHELAYTCVDEPQGFSSSVPPVAEVTADIALVRFHGRSAGRWNRAVATASERFQYLYALDELREWVPRIHRLALRASEVHVLMNNCFQDYAVVNARQMTTVLAAGRAAVAESGALSTSNIGSEIEIALPLAPR